MRRYSIHFIDRQNYVFDREELLSFSDADAIVEIRERPVPGYCGAFEIWRNETLVFRGSLGHCRHPQDRSGEAFRTPHPADWASLERAS